MGSGSGHYRVVAICRHGVFDQLYKRGAPPENWLCAFGKSKGAAFVARYFPSKKGWRLLDIRGAVAVTINGKQRVNVYRGQVRGTKYYPTEDAAVMVAMHKLGCQPELALT